MRDRLPRQPVAPALAALPDEIAEGSGPMLLVVDSALCGGADLTDLARFTARHPEVAVLVTGIPFGGTVAAIRAGAQGRLDPAWSDVEIGERLTEALARQRRLAELRQRSLRDPLTGLYNRRGFLELVDHHLRLARRDGEPLALLYADVDGLKALNDRHGHGEGDRMLVAVARCLEATFRDSDVLGRLGGDEFAVLAIGASAAELESAIGRLDASLAAASGRPDWRIRLSVGASFADGARGPGAVGALLAAADAEMYRAKRRGFRTMLPGERAPAAVVPALLRALCAHPRTSARARGLLAAVLDGLEERLGPEDGRARSLALWVLRELRHELPRQLFEARDDEDPDTESILARALGRLVAPRG